MRPTSLGRFTLAFRAISVAGLVIVACGIVLAERLPLKSYTTADGLAHNNVQRIVRDSRGFLWFCTFEGLSRFDGYSFLSFGVDQGLPSPVVNDLLETRDGRYLVATDGGLCLFNPKGSPRRTPQTQSWNAADDDAMFRPFYPGQGTRSRRVTSLLEDREGAIWCGTAGGLYRVNQQQGQLIFQLIDLGMPPGNEDFRHVNAIIEDKLGALWIASNSGIYRLHQSGQAERYYEPHGLLDDNVNCLLEDSQGRLWAGSRTGSLCRLNPDPSQAGPIVARTYTDKDGWPTRWINQLFEASDGSLWAASNSGLISFVPAAGGQEFRFRVFAEPHGLTYREVQSLTEDRKGNLWLGMQNGGAIKLARSGITAFSAADGFQWASSIFKDRAGYLFVLGGPTAHEYLINEFDGEQFKPMRPNFPTGYYSWGWNQVILNDHLGEWWVASSRGLLRFPRTTSPAQFSLSTLGAAFTTRNGLASNLILRLFEDSRGDIWISAVGENHGLSRWERATNTFHHYSDMDGLPSLVDYYPTAFCEDREGGIWVGFSTGGGLIRFRDGRFTPFTFADGLPDGGIFNLFVDSRGRLWVPTTRGGVCRIDNPGDQHPTGRVYSTADGLSSSDVKCATEDRWGRIYLGTGRGIDRLDPVTERIRHYGTADGALLGDILAAAQDRDGALWFGFVTGPVRLVPQPDSTQLSPPILITGLRISGDIYPISALGEAEVGPLQIGPERNDLQVDFVALGFGSGEDLKYQYKLEGTTEDWSPLTAQRAVNFANLAPGRYRLLVRAVGADGVSSETPASLSFRILPPLWQRWWFLTLASALTGALAYGLYSFRVAQLIEIERVRARISGDLHDDIGANLSKIAILSEVAHQQFGGGDGSAETTVSSIASISRESIASMRDIVWAVNPKRDRLFDLTRRMRGFASDIFTSRDIEFQFQAPDRDRDLKLGPDIRRDVFLIFKEAINNAVRHSGCAMTRIKLAVESGWLVLEVADDGKGFDPAEAREGQGLASMAMRAGSFGGMLEIISAEGEGTTIRLRTPIRTRRWTT
jgi:ligand-binding sensor domain-containing protein/two-component sensor histidine kinase